MSVARHGSPLADQTDLEALYPIMRSHGRIAGDRVYCVLGESRICNECLPQWREYRGQINIKKGRDWPPLSGFLGLVPPANLPVSLGR
jgi:hypothetical protein